MKKYLLSAAAVAAVATAMPANARDGSGYVGVEGGILFAKSNRVQASGTGVAYATYYSYETYEYYDVGPFALDGSASFKTSHKKGLDLDVVAGYDFGAFRLEAELGYKTVAHRKYKDVNYSFDATYRMTGLIGSPDTINADGRTLSCHSWGCPG